MAETTGYEYDIFISYAHDDNSVLSGDKGWVTEFHALLSNWLVRHRGLKNLKIWFDENNLSGNTRFDDAIKNDIENSALFFVIHSQNYKNSEYCNKELDWFLDHNKRFVNGIRVGNESRLFNIQIQNLNHETWSEKLAGTSGFVLHGSEKRDDLGFPTSSHNNKSLFESQMQQVVEATSKTLAALEQMSFVKPLIQPETTTGKPKIFIANASSSLKSFRNQLVSEVSNKVTVLDSLPPPFGVDEHAKQLDAALNQACLSIHLLDQFSGTEIDGATDGDTFPKVQADTARSRDQNSFIWVPDTLNSDDIEEEGQAAWLNELENGPRQFSGFHFVRNSRQAFIDQINLAVDELTKQDQDPAMLSDFLIDTHRKDQQGAFKLADSLASLGIEVEFNKESSDPIRSMENFESSVREVKNLIIMFGQVAPQWVSGRIRTAVKISADQFEKNKPVLESFWIFRLPGSLGTSTLPTVPGVFQLHVLDNSSNDNIDEAVIQKLLCSQREGRAL